MSKCNNLKELGERYNLTDLQIIDIVENQLNNGWIPCSDRLECGRMSREIKFRAWDIEMKRMGLLNDQHDTFTFDRCGRAEYYNLQNGSGGGEYILMQYTGLKDKNGKEIYEGDVCIVSLSYFSIEDEKAIVIFHNGAFQFQYGCEKFFSKPHNAWDEVDVIGNIYENPELLESEVSE